MTQDIVEYRIGWKIRILGEGWIEYIGNRKSESWFKRNGLKAYIRAKKSLYSGLVLGSIWGCEGFH